MSTSHPEAPPPDPASPAIPMPRSAPDASNSHESAARTAFLVRTVRQQDLTALSEVLASSFHAQDGWMGWLYPLLRAGIYEDLKSRLYTRGSHYACLVAVQSPPQTPPRSQPLELRKRLASFNALSEFDLLLGTVEMSLKHPTLLQPWMPKYLYLSNLAVQEPYRRQGVALQLLRTCERIAQDWGFRDLYLHVLENNHRAKRLYWKAGYRLQRIEINPLTVMLGQPRQLFLRKQL